MNYIQPLPTSHESQCTIIRHDVIGMDIFSMLMRLFNEITRVYIPPKYGQNIMRKQLFFPWKGADPYSR